MESEGRRYPASIGERREGFSFEGERSTDPKDRERCGRVVRCLSDLAEPEEARLWLKTELDSIRHGASRPTNKQPERFATYAAFLLREKIEKRQICSSATEEKWAFALRHIFGLKDDEGTHRHRHHWGSCGHLRRQAHAVRRRSVMRNSWEPRINAGQYAPTTVNDWIAVLRVITKKMTADFGLAIDPWCANVDAISTKGHRAYTFEEPNSFKRRRAQHLLRTGLGEVPAALCGHSSRLGHRATPLESLCPQGSWRRPRGRREVGPGASS